MSQPLQALPGFHWEQVRWRGPEETVAEQCSYCDAELSDDSIPLMLFKQDGSAARFCDECQERWFGIRSFPEEAAE